MNFELDDTQREIERLAADVMTRAATAEAPDRLDATPDRFDARLWAEMARTGLLGVAVAEEHDGLGFGLVEAALVCEAVGRAVAPVPYAATAAAVAVIARHADPAQRGKWLPRVATGEAIVVVVPPPSSVGLMLDGAGRLHGRLVGVPWAHLADTLLVASEDGVVLVDPSDSALTSVRGETTAREVALDLVLDGVAVETVGGRDAVRCLRESWWTFLAATQAGVTGAALRMTADYTSQREQFGKPLSTFQGVALKAADAYIDVEAIRATALQAAWHLDEGLDATLAVLTAAWWAAEGGQHCVHLTQHLHGGMGADVTYPVHRYFLWGKQIELMCGGASALLAELGEALAARPDAGEAIVLDTV